MITFIGTVQDGVVKLPSGVRLPDGTQVRMMELSELKKLARLPRNAEMEAEDRRFVEACRPHLGRVLRDEEKG